MRFWLKDRLQVVTTGCCLGLRNLYISFQCPRLAVDGRLGGRFEEHAVEPLVELACCPRLEETTKAHAR